MRSRVCDLVCACVEVDRCTCLRSYERVRVGPNHSQGDLWGMGAAPLSRRMYFLGGENCKNLGKFTDL